jgi:hypothetical protein
MDAMEYRWGRQNHMLLWIMVVGACVAEGGMEEKWFWDRAIHGCKLLGIYTPDGLRDLMSRFMGTVDLHAGLLERLAGYIDVDGVTDGSTAGSVFLFRSGAPSGSLKRVA